jgi:hypothetical protein
MKTFTEKWRDQQLAKLKGKHGDLDASTVVAVGLAAGLLTWGREALERGVRDGDPLALLEASKCLDSASKHLAAALASVPT